MNRYFPYLPALGLPLSLIACTHDVYSPPARTLPLETVAPLADGDIGIQLEGQKNDGLGFGELAVTSGTARVRRGFGGDTDVSVEGSFMHVRGSSKAGTDPSIYAARAGIKQRVLRWLAITGGVGGGTSAGGAFVSPDIGPIFAYENRYAVPFSTIRVGMSVPLSPRAVDTSLPDDFDTHAAKPELTWMFALSEGVRIPLGGWSASDPHGPYGSLLLGGGLIHLASAGHSVSVMQLGGGAEFVF